MSRYDQNELDSEEVQQGDIGFFALDSRTQPEDLPTGVVSLSENMRMNRRTASTRKGTEKMTNDIDPGGTVPLIVPFTVGASAVVRDTWADGLFCSCVFSDPNDDNKEWLFLAGGSSAWAWNEDDGVHELGYPSGETITITDKVDMFQAEGSVYILRGESAPSLTINYISRSTSVATAYVSGGHNLSTGNQVQISGAYPAWYNTALTTVTVSNSTTFTYSTSAPTNLADKLVEAATNTLHSAGQTVVVTNVQHTLSFYAKAAGRDWCVVGFIDSAAAAKSAYFNVTAGTIGNTAAGTTAAIADAGGGWYRCSITFTPAAGSGTAQLYNASANGTATYLGDITKGTYSFGAQLEIGATATDYVPTTSAAATPNLLTYSEDLGNAAWTKSNTTVSTDATEEPATGTITLTAHKVPLRWDGDFSEDFVRVSQGTISSPYIYMPPSDFGLLMQNRAILQYARNQLIISDVLDVESYNSIFGVFALNSGQADFLTGFHPYQDNKALIFGRHSVYLINYVDLDVTVMTSQEITRQIGCVARESICTCGPDVLFLSDLGVFRLQPGLELQLRGNSEPLSAPIDDVMLTINTAVINKACAAYCNNRYYLAVPVNGSTRNNRILVFNFLNNAWESVDTLPNGMYADFLNVKQYGDINTLFVSSIEGGIFAYEQLEVDEFAAAPNDPADFVIAGRLVTRRLLFDSYNIKHFNRCTVNLSLNANSSVRVIATTTNPDYSKTLKNYAVTEAEDVTYPLLINKRGYGLQIDFQNTAGRTTIVNYTAVGYEQNRKNIKIT